MDILAIIAERKIREAMARVIHPATLCLSI